MVLIVVAVVLRANRDRRILLILVPLVIVNGLYMLIKNLPGMTSSSEVQFDMLFQSLAAGVTLLWLAAPALGRRGAIRVVAAFGLAVAVAALAVYSYGARSSEDAALFLILLAGLGGVLVFAPAVSTRLCKGIYRPVRFMLWLGLWMVLGGALVTAGFAAVVTLAFSSGMSALEFLTAVLMSTLVGVIFGGCLYTLYLPYMLLGFVSPFFRSRLQTCLNLHRPAVDEEEQA